MDERIIEADCRNPQDIRFLLDMLDIYKTDAMGGENAFSKEEQRRLIDLFENTPNVLAFLAFAETEAVGASVCFTSFSTFAAKPLINIHDICISPRYRNRGLGRSMMLAIMQKAENLECGKITLEVREDNQVAKHLYTSLGFVESSPNMLFWHKKI